MKEAYAECKVTGVHLMNVTIVCMGYPQMSVEYALAARSENPTPTGLGQGEGLTEPVIFTHGKCTAGPSNWSDRTRELLRELIDSMEQDLLPQHFNITKEVIHARTEPGGHEEAGQV